MGSEVAIMEPEAPPPNRTKKILGIAALGFCLVVGITLFILSCALKGENWWPMFSLVAALLAPFPVLVGAALTGRSSVAQNNFFKPTTQNIFFIDMGLFVTTFFLISGFTLLVVLYHNGVISITALVLSICGEVIVYASVAGYFVGYLLPKPKPAGI